MKYVAVAFILALCLIAVHCQSDECDDSDTEKPMQDLLMSKILPKPSMDKLPDMSTKAPVLPVKKILEETTISDLNLDQLMDTSTLDYTSSTTTDMTTPEDNVG